MLPFTTPRTNTSTTPLIQPPSSLQNATNLDIQPSEDTIPQQKRESINRALNGHLVLW